MDTHKLVVIVSLNGQQPDHEGVSVPATPDEIANEAYNCYKAGASAVHVHGRDQNRKTTADPKVYAEIIRKIRAKCDILIQTTNAVGQQQDPVTGKWSWPSDEQRTAIFNLEPHQDLFCQGMSSFDFYHPEGGYGQVITPQINAIEHVMKAVRTVLAKPAALEMEIMEISVLERLSRLADEGLFDRHRNNFWFNFCMGYGAQPATPQQLLLAVSEAKRLFPNTKWEVCATGKESLRMNTFGLLIGSDIARIGMEDGIYLPNGKPAKNNVALVEAIVRIAREFGREPASVAEAKQVFGI